MTSRARVAVIGAGSIGLAMTLVLARAGKDVVVCDSDPRMRASVPARLAERMSLLRAHGLAAEDEEPAVRVRAVERMEDAVAGAVLVLECTPEILDVKREVFAQLDATAPRDAVLASVSSAFMPSEFAGALAGRERVLVLHPANPPFLIPVVEVVPAPFTAPEAVDRAIGLISAVGMTPVRLGREVTGFAYNRLQGALLREAYCLVRDGVVDVDGVDTLVREGLGMRWAIVGPFETVDLNTRGGIEAHARRLGPAYHRMGLERGQDDPWSDDLVACVTAQRRDRLPLDDWEDRVAWRDERLAALRRHLEDQRSAEASPVPAATESPTDRSTP